MSQTFVTQMLFFCVTIYYTDVITVSVVYTMLIPEPPRKNSVRPYCVQYLSIAKYELRFIATWRPKDRTAY